MKRKRYLLVDALGHIHVSDKPLKAIRNTRVLHIVDMRKRESYDDGETFPLAIAPSPSLSQKCDSVELASA